MSKRGGGLIIRRGGGSRHRSVQHTSGGGGGGGGGRHRQGGNRFSSLSAMSDGFQRIVISNLPSTVDRSDLMDFLKNKAYKPNLVFKGSEFRNQKLFLSVERSDDIPTLIGLSGVRYGGQKIEISRETGGVSAGRTRTNNTNKRDDGALKIALSANKQIKILEDHLGADAATKVCVEFSYLSTTKDIDFNDPKTLRRIFKLVSDKCEKATTISFSHNGIKTLESFKWMIKYSLDYIVNFNFDSNRISEFSELDNLSDLNLRELVFTNNPICNNTNYRMEVARRFPDLQYLDGKQIGPEDFPPSPIPPLRPNYCDSVERQQFAFRFLEKYFTLFDKNRPEIVKAYYEDSKFSLTFLQEGGGGMARGSTKTYQRFNRNLKKSFDAIKKTQLLLNGYEKIYNFFKLFPVTSHYLSSSVIDTFVAPGSQALYVIIHGHFLETTFNTKRSFDRTFVLAPPPAGSESAKAGWEAIILNEQLHIRPYVRFPRLEPIATAPAPAPVQIPQETRDSILAQFISLTSLKPSFAQECLEIKQWDLNQALETFKNLKENGQLNETYFGTA
eukprot:gene10149-12453_t